MSELPPQAATDAVLDDNGYLLLTDEHGECGWYQHAGLRLRWIPLDQPDRVVLQFLGSATRSEQEARDFSEDGFVTGMMRSELRQLIAQLQAIDAMLEDR